MRLVLALVVTLASCTEAAELADGGVTDAARPDAPVSCTPEARACDGVTPLVCGADGTWVPQPGCSAPFSDCALGTCAVPPVCDPEGWCWQHPRPHGLELLRMEGTATDDVWAAGFGVMHWDGTRWRILQLPEQWERRVVVSAGPEDAWTPQPWGSIASDDTTVTYTASFLHWDGTGWIETKATFTYPVAAGDFAGFFRGHARASDDVWFVGALGMTVHWDGSAWTAFPTGELATELYGVWAASAADAWAVGAGGAVLHWDGTSWRRLVAGSSEYPEAADALTAVAGRAADDVFAAGTGGVVMRWNGARWERTPSGTTAPVLQLWATAGGDVLAATATTVLRWDGSAWASLTDNPSGALAIWGAAADDLWAASGQKLLHFDGATWTGSTTATADDWGGMSDGGVAELATPITLRGVWGADDHEAWAVGEAGGAEAGILHWDGSAWKLADTPGGERLWGVWGAAADDVWAVGDAGTVLHWDGVRWTAVPAPLRSDLKAVWGSSAGDVWIVGGLVDSTDDVTLAGTAAVLHWNGSSLVPMASGTTDELGSVWGAGPDAAWAVGGTTFLKWNGSAWAAMEWPGLSWGGTSSKTLVGVWARAADDLWAVTLHNIVHWDGSTWHVVQQPDTKFVGVWGSATDVFIAGGGMHNSYLLGSGEMYRFDGTTWTMLGNSMRDDVTAVGGASSGHLWLVSGRGSVLGRSP